MTDEDAETEWSSTLLGGVYLAVFVIQFIALVYTQSRGPFLGWLAGVYIFVLVALVAFRPRRYRLLSASWLALAGLFVAFLVVFNLPNSPLEPLREHKYIGRLGRVFETEHGTGAVRVLIGEGAVKMILPHAPLQYPPDMRPDRFNALRPLIGYGPESMWVAYNRFYPPKLAHVEHRNASPDRSHNETFDSLIISGLFGFLAYLALFLSIFYYALKWLGLIQQRRQLYLFLGLTIAGGVIAPLIAHQLDHGQWRFFGVSLPVGLIIGLILYVSYASLKVAATGSDSSQRERYLFLLALLAAVTAHFVEIHFGIAIVATRTYFWVMAALLLVVGSNWLQEGAPVAKTTTPQQVKHRSASSRRSRRRRQRSTKAEIRPRGETSLWGQLTFPASLMMFIFGILAFLYTTNQFVRSELPNSNALSIISRSLFTIVRHGHHQFSPYLFYMLTFVGVFSGLILVGETARGKRKSLGWGGIAFTVLTGASILGYLWVALFQALQLAHGAAMQSQIHSLQDLLRLAHVIGGYAVNFYWIFFFLLFVLAAAVWRQDGRGQMSRWSNNGLTMGATVLFGVLALYGIVMIDVALVRADVYFKQGKSFTAARAYDRAVIMYQAAIQVEPKEDYYYLFLGRDQLTIANRVKDKRVAAKYFGDALQTLLRAQALNPLNTDHTANLARYYNNRAHLEKDTGKQRQLLEKAESYYSQAVSLSPHSARLLDEWAMTLLELGRREEAESVLKRSQALDPDYDLTYIIHGDLYRTEKNYQKALKMYQKALTYNPKNTSLLNSLGVTYDRLGLLDRAVNAYQELARLSPKDPLPHRNLAVLYWRLGRKDTALQEADTALQLAPDDQKPAIQKLIRQIKG